MSRQPVQVFAEQYLGYGAPSNTVFSHSFPREQATTDLSALTTQVMLSVGLPLQSGDVVTSLTFVSGATAANVPTNWWFALYSPAGVLLDQSADQLAAAWAANTVKTLALSRGPLVVKDSGLYYAAIMVKATTPPSLVGKALQNAVVAGNLGLSASILAQTSGSALTTTAPGTIATPTTVANLPFVVAS
jgi:hypothetical protein